MGRAVAERFGAVGERVSIIDLNREALPALEHELTGKGTSIAAFAADVRDPDAIDRAFGQAEARFGAVDVLAAAAGILDGALTLDDAAPAVWRNHIDINLSGVFHSNRCAARSMIKGGKRGRILNWSSLASRIGLRGYAAYCASKAGVEALTRVLAVELGKYGITVNAIALGPVATPMIGHDASSSRARAELPAGQIAEPAEVATLAEFLVSPANRFMTGSIIEFSGGLEAVRGSWTEAQLPERFRVLHNRTIDPALLRDDVAG
jgi:3-oxoacyl-[acyl-carrier protein] reductase